MKRIVLVSCVLGVVVNGAMEVLAQTPGTARIEATISALHFKKLK